MDGGCGGCCCDEWQEEPDVLDVLQQAAERAGTTIRQLRYDEKYYSEVAQMYRKALEVLVYQKDLDGTIAVIKDILSEGDRMEQEWKVGHNKAAYPDEMFVDGVDVVHTTVANLAAHLPDNVTFQDGVTRHWEDGIGWVKTQK